jgi:hypothetical protein
MNCRHKQMNSNTYTNTFYIQQWNKVIQLLTSEQDHWFQSTINRNYEVLALSDFCQWSYSDGHLIWWNLADSMSCQFCCLYSLSQSSVTKEISSNIKHFCTIYRPNTDPKTNVIADVDESFWSNCYKYDSNVKTWEQISSNRFYSIGVKDKQKTFLLRKDQMKFVLVWSHHHGICWFNLQNKWVCLHYEHKLQQNQCIYIHIR